MSKKHELVDPMMFFTSKALATRMRLVAQAVAYHLITHPGWISLEWSYVRHGKLTKVVTSQTMEVVTAPFLP